MHFIRLYMQHMTGHFYFLTARMKKDVRSN